MTHGRDDLDRSANNSIVDPLLDCLVLLTKIYQHPLSHEALRAGLPLVNHRFTPEIFVRAAERAGFAVRIVKRSLKRMNNLVLPAVLLLNKGDACILHKVGEGEALELQVYDSGGGVIKKTLSELEAHYSGYAIFLNPVYQFESRSQVNEEAATEKSWFWGTIWRYHSIYTQVIIAAFFVNLFALLSPLFVMTVYDRVIPNFALTTLWVLVIGILTIFTFDFILRALRSYLIDVCGKKADIVISSALFQTVLGIQLTHKPSSVGAFVNNLREFEVLRDFITSTTLTTIIDLPFIFLYFILIAYLGGSIVLIPLIIVICIFCISLFIEKPMRADTMQALQGVTQKNAILVEALTGLETVKCLSIEGEMQGRYEKAVAHAAKHGLIVRFYSSLIVNLMNYGQQLMYILTVTYGVYLINDNLLTVGGLIACNILAGRILAPLTQFTTILTRFQQARLSFENLKKVMELPQERSLQKKFLHLPRLKGFIEFEKVTFSYPNQTVPAIEDLSFKIAEGEHVAILGPIGSGKTTIQKLLLGLYQPQAGHIRVDGVDLSQIDPANIRKNMGYVPQDGVLFFGTVRDNILMSMPHAQDQLLFQVAKLTGVDKFVSSHPRGYDLMIGERGEGISGGQKQAIAIARALVSNPPIWLFDEPTSAMDNQTEMTLLRQLAPYLSKKTLLLVTHRLTLLPLVERLIIIDKGKLVQDGSKEAILASLQNKKQPEADPHA